MTQKNALKLFDDKKIRTLWDDVQEKWYFSIIDVVQVLTDQSDFQKARNYWKVLKNKLIKEGNQTVTNCNRLKLLAEDGKMRITDIITETWAGKTTKEFKHYKGLKKENLRDNMSNHQKALKKERKEYRYE